MLYTVENIVVNQIPMYVVAPEGATNCPTVLFVHGFGGDKVAGMELGMKLAAKGFVFVSVDAFMHGERHDPRLDDVSKPELQTYPGTYLDQFFLLTQIVEQTSTDINHLIEYFSTDKRVDPNGIGMCGVSMGGMVTWKVLASNPRIKAAVPIITVPSIAQMWEDEVLESYAKPNLESMMKQLKSNTQRLTEFIKSIDPGISLEGFAPKPLLMLNGNEDVVTNKLYNIEVYRRLRPLYEEHPENLGLTLYNGVPHRSTHQMFKDASDWFVRHLCR